MPQLETANKQGKMYSESLEVVYPQWKCRELDTAFINNGTAVMTPCSY